MSDQQESTSLPVSNGKSSAKRTLRTVTRQDSIPTSTRDRLDSSHSRRGSQPIPQSHARLRSQYPTGNIANAVSGSTSARSSSSQMSSRLFTSREPSSPVLRRNLKLNPAEPLSSSGTEPTHSKVSPKKKPELGKGRLERGKQISHLGLFPLSENKQVQRQSTSMTAEPGDDHLANLDDVVSSHHNEHKRHLPAAPWKKQIDLVTKFLLDYAESHPQFSSQLTSCRLNNIAGLKATKSARTDQLTVSITFDITSNTFDSNDSRQKNGLRKQSAPLHKSTVKASGDAAEPRSSVGTSEVRDRPGDNADHIPPSESDQVSADPSLESH